jgi:hypothetical protein
MIIYLKLPQGFMQESIPGLNGSPPHAIIYRKEDAKIQEFQSIE